MKCVNCGAKIGAMDKFFNLSTVQNGNMVVSCPICKECAEVVTPMELYMKDVIPMANSDDDTVEVNAVVINSEPYEPSAEEIASAENPIDEIDTYVDKLEANCAVEEIDVVSE